MIRIASLSALAALAACSPKVEEAAAPPHAETPASVAEPTGPNTLSHDEQVAGWKLLFNGNDLAGWHIYGKPDPLPDTPATEGWSAANGEIALLSGGVGDLTTDEVFGPFELSVDWKISPGGNSGIIYLVNETPEAKYSYQSGPEMQVLDDAGHADGKIPSHQAGSLYDFAPPLAAAARPVGEWNTAVVRYDGKTLTHTLNGQKVAESTYGDEAWIAKVAATKFKTMPLFGTASVGRIALQDHGDKVWYRNIKIRPLTTTR